VVLIKATSKFIRCLSGKSYIGVSALLNIYIDGVVLSKRYVVAEVN